MKTCKFLGGKNLFPEPTIMMPTGNNATVPVKCQAELTKIRSKKFNLYVICNVCRSGR